ncbi:major facilitator superfamily domain-containing protein [Apiospora hydei]|uniref:Major facilitator superfamily domain-containing protein n=1 Tax=Apiospora hydei TaxID=1337664 RepID=A0ABR1WWX2_9PEZI
MADPTTESTPAAREVPTSTKQPTSNNEKRGKAETQVSRTDLLGQLEEAQVSTVKHDANDYVTGIKLVTIVASVALACFLMCVDTMVISTAIPRITDDFKSLADVGWYASAYQFGSAAPQPLTGKIYTHFNTKWSFLLFFGIFEVGSVVCGAAASSAMLIVGRTIAGLGAAGIINGAITIVSSCAPLEKRPRKYSQLIITDQLVNQLGLVAGPLIGGTFTSGYTWRWWGLAALAILLLRIPEQTSKKPAPVVFARLHHYLDLLGFVLFSAAVLQLLLALQFGGNTAPWGSAKVIGLFCGSGATAIVWYFWNRYKGEDALLPHSMINRRTVWASGLYQAFLMSAVYGAVFYLPIYFQAINSASPILSGVYLLPTILPQLVMVGASGKLLTVIGYVIPLALASTVILSVGSGLCSLLQPGSPTGYWVGFQILAGAGSGLGLQLAIIAIQGAVTEEELSSAMAFVIFTQSLGPAIALALCQLIFLESIKTQVPLLAPNANGIVDPGDLTAVLKAYATSIDHVFYLVAGMAVACGIALWGMGWQNLRKKSQEAEDDQGSARDGKAH